VVSSNAFLGAMALRTSSFVDNSTLTPIAWIHIPKAGTSFVNTLIHHPGVCAHMPEDEYVTDNQHDFWEKHPKSTYCPGGFSDTYHSPPGHHGMGQQYEQNRGHIIALFRQPEERHLSAYHYNQHSYPLKGNASNISEFFNAVKGCQVRMLTRDSDSDEGAAQCGGQRGGPTTQKDVDEAIRRMKDMRFVGLTEQFDFSICLFHAMYGGICRDHEFVNTRPNPYEHSALDGLKDEFDTPLYEAASKKFWRLMKKHNLDRAACEKVCTDATTITPFSLKMHAGRIPFMNASQFAYDWPGRRQYVIE
jgi:hypothetical protein